MNELSQFDVQTTDFEKPITGHPKSRYIKPRRVREIPERMMKYELAEKLAKDLVPEKGLRAFVFLDGKFIAGDFIEAWIVTHNIHVKRLTISTLSMSQANVDSLANLLNGNFVDQLDLVVSGYFFSHERGGLIPYIYNRLDVEDKFQLAVCDTHCKLAMIETTSGQKITMHGSANLRSSGSLEHICIEEGSELYDFNIQIQECIIERYKTIKKHIRTYKNELWEIINPQ